METILKKNTAFFHAAHFFGEQEFLKAYDQHAEAMFRYCYYRVFDREKAKDCMQEAYCRVWKYILEGKEIENMRAFLYRTVNNIIIDWYRKKKSVSLDYIMEKGFLPKADDREKTQAYFDNQDIINLVQSLDEKYREVILLKYVEDLSTRQIASILNESENNVYVRLSRGLEKVRELLKARDAKMLMLRP